MSVNILERPSPPMPIPPDTPSPDISDLPHSEGGFVSTEIAQRKIDRLRGIIQNGRKPYRLLDLESYFPDPTGTKSFDEIVLQGEASKISVNNGPNMDYVDYSCSSTPERIVRIQTGVEGAPVRGSSAHGVLFLRLGTQRGQLLDVAVKAFTKPSHAFSEYVNTLVIRERGIDTLEPIAVIIESSEHLNGNGKQQHSASQPQEPIGFYLSAMEPIRSLDRLRIIRNGYMQILNGGEKEKEYLKYLSMIGKTLAEMHLKGVFSRDSQIKNFAIRGDRSLIPIDFENTNIYNEELHITNPEKFVDASFRSLSVLFGSLNNEGSPPIDFYAGFTREALWEVFDNTVFSAYRFAYEERLLSMADAGSLDENQFMISLENLELIREKVRERILTPVSSSHQ